jgi:oxygen-dependent protoporphyrinogen oxidase
LCKTDDIVYKTTMGSSERVFIVGAGPSGLTAGYRLGRAGVATVTLEARDYVGGQVCTHREQGYLMERGATILPSAYVPVTNLVEELGITEQLIPAGAIVGFARDGRIHDLRSNHLGGDALRTDLIGLRSKLAMLRLGIDNVRARKGLGYDDLSRAAAWDTMTPKEYCDRHLGMSGEVYDYVVDSTVRGVLGTRGDRISLAEFFFMINKILGSKLWAIKDGYSAYTEALAAGQDIRLGCRVTEVVETPGGVRVTWEDAAGEHVEEGTAAIVTTRADHIGGIVPGLPEEDRRFLDSVRYTQVVQMNLGLAKAPPGIAAAVVQVPEAVDAGLMAFTLEHNKAPGRAPDGKGLVCLMSMTEWAQTLIHEDDDTVLREMTRAAEKLMPGFSDDIDFVQINRWPECIIYSRPGLYTELGRFIARRAAGPGSRIKLGGTFYSSSNMCTATAGGERTAREVLALPGVRPGVPTPTSGATA